MEPRDVPDLGRFRQARQVREGQVQATLDGAVERQEYRLFHDATRSIVSRLHPPRMT